MWWFTVLFSGSSGVMGKTDKQTRGADLQWQALRGKRCHVLGSLVSQNPDLSKLPQNSPTTHTCQMGRSSWGDRTKGMQGVPDKTAHVKPGGQVKVCSFPLRPGSCTAVSSRRASTLFQLGVPSTYLPSASQGLPL